jgi:NAD(P)-dependent dehydrogenase (short-subunit alcohol dehydrogenase family)
MQKTLKIVILGGYGNFGKRIALRLSGHPNIQLIIAGRSLEKAQGLAQQLGNSTIAAKLDIRAHDLGLSLRELGAGLVIHTAGPFQSQNYSIPLAVATAGAHYIDLADGRQFVCEFPQAMNATFSKAGKLAITGASTVPALSSAVVNALSMSMERVDLIDICIAPAQAARPGIATLKAVLGYCGETIPIFNKGKWVHGYGWAELHSIKFARMRSRLGALCDIPDLALFPRRYTGVQTVMFRAALEVGLTQRLFAALSFLRRRRLLPHLDRFARLIHLTAPLLDRFGSKLGGMVVHVSGINQNGTGLAHEWHITADDNHGPEIPCMAAILLARKLANQEMAVSGAYCCMDLLTLQEFESEFRFWSMPTDVVRQ